MPGAYNKHNLLVQKQLAHRLIFQT
jgi:hypothetical protein